MRQAAKADGGAAVPGHGPAQIVPLGDDVVDGQGLPLAAGVAADEPLPPVRLQPVGVDAPAGIGGGADPAFFGDLAVPQPFAGDDGGAGVHLVQLVENETIGVDGFELGGLAVGGHAPAAKVDEPVADALEGDPVGPAGFGATFGFGAAPFGDDGVQVGAGFDGGAEAGRGEVGDVGVGGKDVQDGGPAPVAGVGGVADQVLAGAQLAGFVDHHAAGGFPVQVDQVGVAAQVERFAGAEVAAVDEGPGEQVRVVVRGRSLFPEFEQEQGG